MLDVRGVVAFDDYCGRHPERGPSAIRHIVLHAHPVVRRVDKELAYRAFVGRDIRGYVAPELDLD